MKLRNKVLSFTLIELIITLIITSIITSIVYFALSSVYIGYSKFYEKSINSNQITSFISALENDLNAASKITVDGQSLYLRYTNSDSIIVYKFNRDIVLRENINNVDSFFLKEVRFLTYQLQNSAFINVVKIDYLFNESIRTKYFKKKYSAAQLIENNY